MIPSYKSLGTESPITRFEEVRAQHRDLTERRTKFIYEAARICAMAQKAPIVPRPWDEREEPFKAQMRDVIIRECNPITKSNSPKEAHDAWAYAYMKLGWTWGADYDPANKKHPDLVPFEQLQQQEQDKDAIFLALCDIAAKWIY